MIDDDQDDDLVMLSIRLPPSLISDYRLIAADKKMGYQRLMREALAYMAKVEFKRIATEAIEDKQQRTLKAEKRKSTKPA